MVLRGFEDPNLRRFPTPRYNIISVKKLNSKTHQQIKVSLTYKNNVLAYSVADNAKTASKNAAIEAMKAYKETSPLLLNLKETQPEHYIVKLIYG